MNDLSADPIFNTVHDGIKRGIRVLLDSHCLGSAVVLILSGIDAMAYVGMPSDRDEVTRADFVAWADRYIRFPCRDQVSGMDLYGARCAALHHYGTASRLSRDGSCREVGYVDRAVPEVIYVPSVSAGTVLVSVPALAEAFFSGVDRFLVELFAEKSRGDLGERRFQNLFRTYPLQRAAAEDLPKR